MEKKYFLYIDILGFSNLVMESEAKVRRLYSLIDSLNVYHHPSFKTIIFSDTVLIYNKDEPISEHDHEYLVMYLIEFAQNLLYKLIGKNYYFRAVLVHGEFEHAHLRNIEYFFGKALVDTHHKLKNIKCTGLFIDRHCQTYNNIFPVEEYNKDLSFVYLNQSLERLHDELGSTPVDAGLLYQTDSQWDLAKDVRMLKDIHHFARNHHEPEVRAKFLATLDFYVRRHPGLMQELERGEFNPSVICPKFDWSDACSRILDGCRGFGIDVPDIKDFKATIRNARDAGRKAAELKHKELCKNPNSCSKLHAPCGRGAIILDVDGRSKIGKFFKFMGNTIKDVSIWKDLYGNGFYVYIHGMHNRQEKVIDEAGSEAALKVLEKKLSIDGYVQGYYD